MRLVIPGRPQSLERDHAGRLLNTARAYLDAVRTAATHQITTPAEDHVRLDVHLVYATRPQRHPQGLLGVPCSTRDSAGVGPTPFALSPRLPAHVADALHRLAETPGLTLTEYTRRKREILNRHNRH